MSLALTIDSAHTKQWLQSLHPNIIGKHIFDMLLPLQELLLTVAYSAETS